MSGAFTWFALGLKRLVKKPGILAAAVLPILFALCFSTAEEHGDQIVLGLYVEKEDILTQAIEEGFSHREGMFLLRRYESEKALTVAVQKQEIECGYLLPENFLETMENGKTRQSITVVESPATILAKAADEVFFSVFFQAYSKMQAMAYGEKQEFFSIEEQEAAAKEIDTLIQENLRDGSVFSFRYETIEANGTTVEKKEEQSLFPLRGVVAILVFAAGIFGTVHFLQDKKKGIFLRMSPHFRYYAAFLSAFLPAAIFGGVGIVSFTLGNVFSSLALELSSMGLYCLAVAAFSVVLLGIFPNQQTICGILPLLTLGSILFAPIFFSVESFLPKTAGICQLFLPRQYLKIFTGGSIMPLFLWMIGAFGIGYFIFWQKQKGNKL